MDPLTRAETLQILSFMGVEIPKNTKLPGDLLDKRLQDALNAAQNRDNLPITPPLDPETTKKWPVRLNPPERESLRKKVWRGSMEEAQNIIHARETLGEYRRGLFQDPFWDLRQTMMNLGDDIDKGLKWLTIEDPDHQLFSINVRLLPTLQIDFGTPGIVVLYRAFNRATVLEAIKWIQNQGALHGVNKPGLNRTIISASPLEAKLILKLLEVNSKLLSPHYNPPRDSFEEEFKVSILLPIGPLGFSDLGRLSNDPGCAVCGKERKSRCSQCQSVSYCSVACQKADWPTHKQTCRSLKGGRWCTIPFRVCPPGEGGQPKPRSTRLDVNHPQPWTDADRTWPHEDDPPPPNIHGDKAFLVKMQAPLVVWAYPAFLVYDRQHSFGEVFFSAQDGLEVYAEFMEEVQGPRGGYRGGKMYRWARRTGERELTVCLDKEPTTEIKW
ncbi:hypothetical protein GSI_08970 [Ganoderma sinense ZZ0214-1]|uniref:MYND-type domain-containing protein n=1 Tax=Ganoderma sinense ZZ0214-1 TaxID=1077348 RepID=A0A2G8S572_9APHY|nr:hypothetical protein GSI_08970 [Ganoderma sinense ZZ0214-1]